MTVEDHVLDLAREEIRELRRQLIVARNELDDAALAVARLVLEKKQMLEAHEAYKQAIMNRIADLDADPTLLDIAITNGII